MCLSFESEVAFRTLKWSEIRIMSLHVLVCVAFVGENLAAVVRSTGVPLHDRRLEIRGQRALVLLMVCHVSLGVLACGRFGAICAFEVCKQVANVLATRSFCDIYMYMSVFSQL
jgi:hypothetical protein